MLSSLTKKRVTLYLAHLLMLMMPLEQRIVPAVLALFLLMNIATESWHTRVKLFKKRGIFIGALSGLYLLNIVGLLYTSNMQSGLFHLEMQLSLLIVPLLLLTSTTVNKYTLPELLKTFIIGNVVALVISMIYAAIRFYKFGNPDLLYYTQFSFFMHPGYSAMYANFAISLLISFIYHSKNRVNYKYYIGLILLIVGVYQLSSRTGLIVLILNLVYGFFTLVLPRVRWKNQLSAYVLFTGIGLGIAGISYFVSEGLKRGNAVEESVNSNSSFGVRLAMWKSSVDLVLENPILGVGTGDAQDIMQKQFKEERLAYALVHNLNVHNQFFQVAIAFGLLGLMALLIPMLLPLKYVWFKGNYLFILFLGNVGVNFLTESILEKQGGVIFYAIMWTLLYFTWND